MVVLLNLAWIAMVTVPAALAKLAVAPGWVPALLALAGFVPANAALWYATRQIAREDDPDWRDLVIGIKRHSGLSLHVTLVWLLGVGLLAINYWFYYGRAVATNYPVLYAVVGFWCIALGYFLMVTLFMYPFSLEQQVGAWRALHKSWLLTADNPGMTFWLAIVFGVWTLLATGPLTGRVSFLSGISVMILVFGYVSVIAVAAQVAFSELMRKYQEGERSEQNQVAKE